MSSNTVPFLFPAAIQEAYQKRLYADLNIICGKTEFLAHKIILCSQSKFFHAACSNKFMVRMISHDLNFVTIRELMKQQESSSNTIDLTADGISLVSRMIVYMYYGTYYEEHDELDDGLDWESENQLHARMYALGEKYDIIGLKDVALVKFKQLATKTTVLDLSRFVESIPIVYSSTPDSDRRLRDVTIERIKASPSSFVKKASFKKVVFDIPDFSWDLHQCWMSAAPKPKDSAKRKR